MTVYKTQAGRDIRDALNNLAPAAYYEEREIETEDVIWDVANLRDHAESVLRLYVHAAREAGVGWERIGTALGVSKQAAQQKYGPSGPRRERHPL